MDMGYVLKTFSMVILGKERSEGCSEHRMKLNSVMVLGNWYYDYWYGLWKEMGEYMIDIRRIRWWQWLWDT